MFRIKRYFWIKLNTNNIVGSGFKKDVTSNFTFNTNGKRGLFAGALYGGIRMKLRIAVVATLCVGLVCGIASMQAYAQGARVTVYNPMGTPPPITMREMAPRLDTLDGKTIYLVNTGFPNSGSFMEVLRDWFKENRPKTNIVIISAGMENINANQRAELSEKADAVIFGIGH